MESSAFRRRNGSKWNEVANLNDSYGYFGISNMGTKNVLGKQQQIITEKIEPKKRTTQENV